MSERPSEAGSSYGPASQQALRRRNMQVILSSLRLEGPGTQRDLSERTGFSTATISNLVQLLVQEDLARTSPTIRSGRRATLVEAATDQAAPK